MFEVESASGYPTFEHITRLAAGRVAAIHLSGSLSLADARQVAANFLSSEFRCERSDGVAGAIVGVSHYQKTPATYVRESQEAIAQVESLFTSCSIDSRFFHDSLAKDAARRRVSVRPAEHQGRHSAHLRALSWTGDGAYVLAPHDDQAQVKSNTNEDFEIRGIVGSVVSLAIYARARRPGGEVRLWNWAPTESVRRRLGVEETGYPYGESTLADREWLDVAVRSGDVLLFAGNLVHAVVGCPAEATGSPRVLLLGFLGVLEDGDCVWWT